MSQSNPPQNAGGISLTGGAAILAPITAFPNGVPGNALVLIPIGPNGAEMQKKIVDGPVALQMDEVWKLLENEAGASFLGEVYRTFRKYYASAIAISQNIDDFAKSRVAGAVMPNSSIKWILRQKGADLDRLKTVLHLNDNEMELIGSLRQERGVYSEAFLMAQDDHGVVAVEATPLEYWIATTDPRELAAIDTAVTNAPDMPRLELLKALARAHPRGLLAS